MGLGDHLDELRRRLIYALGGLAPIFVVGLVVGPTVLEWLILPLMNQLQAAGEPSRLQATGPLESFVSYLKVALGITIIAGFPWVLVQGWLFVAPGLFPREKRFVYFLVPMSALLTAASVLFLFRVLLPISLYFLIVFGTGLAQSDVSSRAVDAETLTALRESRFVTLQHDPAPEQLEDGMVWVNSTRNEVRLFIEPRRRAGEEAARVGGVEGALGADEIVGGAARELADDGGDGADGARPTVAGTRGDVRVLRLGGDGLISQDYRIGEYVSLVFRLAVVFGLAFQLPLVMLLLGWLDLLRLSTARRYRRYVAFGCVVAGAFLTPQDPWSMALLGGALYVLFEFGLLLMRFVTPAVVAGSARGRGEAGERNTDADEGDE